MLFQSTHLRGAICHYGTSFIPSALFQSMHPIWGCDVYLPYTDGRLDYFNPRTCMGATLNLRPNRSKIRHFNPRTRVGCDHPNSKSCLNWLNYFNPRTRVGCDGALLPGLWPQWFSCSSKYPTGYRT